MPLPPLSVHGAGGVVVSGGSTTITESGGGGGGGGLVDGCCEYHHAVQITKNALSVSMAFFLVASGSFEGGITGTP